MLTAGRRLLAREHQRIVVLRILVFAFAVSMERRRIASESPEKVRRVDARTGAAPSLRQTIVVLGTRETLRLLLDRLLPRPGAAQRRARPELKGEIERVRALHADDPSAQQEAIRELFRQRQVVKVSVVAMLARTVAQVAADRCPLPFLAERRTLADLLAGTKLVRREGRSPWTRLRQRRERLDQGQDRHAAEKSSTRSIMTTSRTRAAPRTASECLGGRWPASRRARRRRGRRRSRWGRRRS
jgi:hypothetical protein